MTIEIAALGGVEIDRRGLQTETQGLHFLVKALFFLGKDLGQFFSQEKFHRLVLGSQGPEGAVSLHHRDILGMADIQ